MKKRTTVWALGVTLVPVISGAGLMIAYTQGVFAGEPTITEEEAKSIAEEHTNGIADSVELEREGSSLVYEVTIANETGRYEVEIDAKDGTILEVEIEEGKDDD